MVAFDKKNIPAYWLRARRLTAEIAGYYVVLSVLKINDDGTVLIKVWETEQVRSGE